MNWFSVDICTLYPGLSLTVEHRVLLHAHERGVRVSLGKGVALSHGRQLLTVPVHSRYGVFLYLPDCL